MSDILQPATLPAWIITLPLAAAGLSVMLPKIGRSTGFVTAVAVSALAAMLARSVLQLGTVKMQIGGWQPPLGIELYADGLSAVMLCLTALIMGVITLYAASYFSAQAAARYFWPLWLFLWSALNAVFLAGDIFNLYVTLELLGLSAVTLVALSRTHEALPAAMRYLLVSLTGSLSYLMGVALLYAATGTLHLKMLADTGSGLPATTVAFALMAGGLIMKSALFPLHFWLPPAHASAPAPVSAVLSALVVKASFYITIRLWLVVFEPLINPTIAQVIGALSVMAIMWGSVQALMARRLKLMVAYSTVAQIGYLFMIFPLISVSVEGQAAWQGGIYFVVSHACAKAAVFLVAGNVLYAIGHDRIADLTGLVSRLPVSMFAFALAGVSLIGLPPSGGFIAKWFYLNASLTSGHWWWSAFILLGGLLATAYVFRFFSKVFSYSTDVVHVRPVPRVMEWTALTLALCAIILGVTSLDVIRILMAGEPL